jgi:prevent-host-death family protein
MLKTTVSKSEFKAKALEYMRFVEQNNQPIIVTDMGNPVIHIVPYDPQPKKSNLYELRGTLLKYIDPMEPVGVDDWEALR